MIRYSTIVMVATACVFGASLSKAVELGPLEISSAFGEPLEAQIELLDSARLSKRNLAIRFYDYRVGDKLLRPSQVLVLARLKYEIIQPESGGARRNKNWYIRLYTTEVLEEARLAFRIRARVGRNEFTARRYLFVLPDTLVAGSDGARVDRRRSQRLLAARRQQNWELALASPKNNSFVSSSDYNALWTVAQQLKSGYGISAFQAMLAIFDINRHAFALDGTGNKNINLLQATKELRMPTVDEMRSYDRTSSIVEVARQNYYSDTGPLDVRALRQILRLEPVAVAPVVAPRVSPEPKEAPVIRRPEPEPAPVIKRDPSRTVEAELPPPSEAPFVQRQPDSLPQGGAVTSPAEALGRRDSDLEGASGTSWLFYLLIVLAIAVLGAAGYLGYNFFMARRQEGSGSARPPAAAPTPPAAGARSEQEVDNQLALLRAHVEMKDSTRAGSLHERIQSNPNATGGQKQQARDLVARLEQSDSGDS
ncbi:MAG: type IV pilus assembly protein FimV [Gammaproteobacteria bacterium]